MSETEKKLAELMARAKVTIERERREETGLTVEEFANLREDPHAQERNRRRLIRGARAAHADRREQSKRNK